MRRLGIDSGGTFTDVVLCDEDHWEIRKIPSTPEAPQNAVLEGVRCFDGIDECPIVHGSTVATNALLQKRLAKVALVTNEGFKDVFEIGRQNRRHLYRLIQPRRPSLVPSSHRFEVPGRILSDAQEAEAFDPERAEAVAEQLKALKVEAVAICFLFSFLNPSHEISMARILKRHGFRVSLSHRIVGEFREFERFSTTIVNAALLPIMGPYLHSLECEMPKRPIGIMQSNGGRIRIRKAAEEPVRTVLSGPAGGVIGAGTIARSLGLERVIAFDMGGTSTDVSLIDGDPLITTESVVSEFPLKVPMLDIHTVGAGGGSIARLDQGGALRVGPESAGADPGPVCYGQGTALTVTDANLFLGRLLEDRLLGDAVRLDAQRVEPLMASLAEETGLTPSVAAEGVLTVVNAVMERALRNMTVERGHDPRDFTLIAFGGAGPMHAVFLARALGIRKVVVPENPGTLSAMGMLAAKVVKDVSLTVMLPADTALEVIEDHFAALERAAAKDLNEEGIPETTIVFERSLDMRYEGQSYELFVPYAQGFIDAFHRLHDNRYGYHRREAAVEIVNVRLRAAGADPKLPQRPQRKRTDASPERALLERKCAVFEGRVVSTPVYERRLLQYGHVIDGPALIVEYSSTTVLPPGARLRVDAQLNLDISTEAPPAEGCGR